MKQQETFAVRSYGKSELAMLYFPDSASKDAALRRFRYWLSINPRLKKLLKVRGRNFTPKEVKNIVDEFGEPFETESSG